MSREDAERVDEAAVAAVLAGEASYDDLDDAEQAVVRAEWDKRVAEIRDGLDLVSEFRAKGWTPWAEADAEGNTVFRS